ncbi:MAG: DnaB-like helicase C-terminal domain-containing protein [Burkholderiaceae bacterium]
MAVILDHDIDFSEYLQETAPQAKVHSAGNYASEVISEFAFKESFAGAGLALRGARELLRLLTGEVTLWAGINSHGKSRILSQMTLGLCAQGYKCCATNFESAPKKTLAGMARQATCKSFPTPADVHGFMAWCEGKLWVFDHVGRVRQELLYAVIRYCRDRLNVTHFVIDNLQMVVAGEDDYNAQKEFVQALKAIAIELEMHIHLVHHVRKSDSEDRMPGKFDIRGAGSIVDMVDNAFIMWRNKAKERVKDTDKWDDKEPDAKLAIVKNRENGHEKTFRLWFDPVSTQYLRDMTRAPIDLMTTTDW